MTFQLKFLLKSFAFKGTCMDIRG